ncbi:MAG: N-acetylmuramoyl-L-alanine amidase [Candidatus Acetothermia bacterium]
MPRNRAPEEINYIVIHTVQGSLESAVRTFGSSGLSYPRSAHYTVGKSGEVVKSVPVDEIAWHAGTDPPGSGGKHESKVLNENSIGIEHGGYVDESEFPTREQYVASAALTRYLSQVYDIPIDRDHIVGHDEIKSTKGDPGPQWNWDYYMGLVRRGTKVPYLPTEEEGDEVPARVTGGYFLPLTLLGTGIGLISLGLLNG